MAYFVVFLRQLKKYVVLPAAWIKDIDKHYEKFVNNSLNRSQLFLCFFTSNEAAFIDGCPDNNFAIDFDSEIVDEINPDGTFNGCFLGKLKRFHGECSVKNRRSKIFIQKYVLMIQL